MKESFLFFVVYAIGLFSIPVQNQIAGNTPENIIGNSLENLKNLKRDCEKDLPRDQECTLLYEFVPTKTKGEQ